MGWWDGEGKDKLMYIYVSSFSFITLEPEQRYLGSVIFAFKTTLTTTLNHITCINTFGQDFKKDAIRYQCSLY